MRWTLLVFAGLFAGLFATPSMAGEARHTPSPTFFALSVADLDASVAWYAKMLDLKANPVHDADGVRITLMTGERLVVELIEHKEAQGAGDDEDTTRRYLRHGLFKVGYYVDDLDAEVERLGEHGARFRGRVVTDELLRARTILVLDPEGNIVQLFERLEDA
ncbi:MAG: VOC family protein [Lysobacteraceae bacterium]